MPPCRGVCRLQELYTLTTRQPAVNSCIDARLGISNAKELCGTCNRRLADCSGHFGYIPLTLPVFHIGYFRPTLNILQCICKTCSRVLITGKSRKRHLAMMQDPRLDSVRKEIVFRAVMDVRARRRRRVHACGVELTLLHLHAFVNAPSWGGGGVSGDAEGCSLRGWSRRFFGASSPPAGRSRCCGRAPGSSGPAPRHRVVQEACKVRQCPYCGSANGVIRKVPGATTLKITHDATKFQLPAVRSEFIAQFETASELNPDIKDLVPKAKEDLSPIDVLRLFRNIPDEDIDLLFLHGTLARPEALILTHVLVPPVCIRPSVAMDAGAFNEDDITVKLQEIVTINESVGLALEKGAAMRNVMESWGVLQTLVANLINGDLPGFPAAAKSQRPIRGYCQRLKGKSGRFRYGHACPVPGGHTARVVAVRFVAVLPSLSTWVAWVDLFVWHTCFLRALLRPPLLSANPTLSSLQAKSAGQASGLLWPNRHLAGPKFSAV